MHASQSVPKAFRIYAGLVIAVTVLLIWWGAAVTTENVGMAVPDWPLSFGTVNPEGWWQVPALRLEHGHRLVASVVGLLTLGLCAWAWLGTKHRLLRMLTVAAVVGVILQGVMGGMRVLHISDHFGIIHGCLGQAFFCLLLLIFLVSGDWERRVIVSQRRSDLMRWGSLAIFGSVFLQLIFGAVLRHTQRFHLADDAILTTGGTWFPGFGEPDLLVLFLHKWWAVVVLGLVVTAVVWTLTGPRKGNGIERLVYLAGGLVLAQVALGVSVIVTGKSFWVTNIHVINGLAILATSFVLLVRTWRSQPGSALLAKAGGPPAAAIAS